MPDAPRPCDTHPDLVGFKYPLPHLAQSLEAPAQDQDRGDRLVVDGGRGQHRAVSARLELALRRHSYGRMIDVLNRGIGGQEAPEELSRFEPDVIGEAPALVIWQVGTNAVFHDEVYSPDDVARGDRGGLDWLAGLADGCGADGPAIHDGDRETCKRSSGPRTSCRGSRPLPQIARVNLFRRFALMERWGVQDGIPIDELIDPTDNDRLHMSEWATNCVDAGALRCDRGRAVGAAV